MQKSGSMMTSFLRTEDQPLEWFLPDPVQLARHDDPEKIRLFGQDLLANGQLHAVSATEDRRLIAGHGRLLAARSAGLAMLRTNIFPASITETQFRLIRLSENLQTQTLSQHLRWVGCHELMTLNPDWRQSDLAEYLHLDASTVVRILSPAKAKVPGILDALKDGKLGLSTVYAITKGETPEEQQRLLDLCLAGASRDAVEKEARKGKAKQQPPDDNPPKLTRVPIPLPKVNASVSVTTNVATLESVLTVLAEASETVRRAIREKISLPTARRAWSEKAKAEPKVEVEAS